jgi:hypothetical protein
MHLRITRLRTPPPIILPSHSRKRPPVEARRRKRKGDGKEWERVEDEYDWGDAERRSSTSTIGECGETVEHEDELGEAA